MADGLKRPFRSASDFFHKAINQILQSKGPNDVLTNAERERVLGWRDNMRFFKQLLTRFATVYPACCARLYFNHNSFVVLRTLVFIDPFVTDVDKMIAQVCLPSILSHS
jgi:hypothetical protein